MGSPIRVLHAVVNLNRGGAETLIMNLYRNIDRSKVQFDFLTSKPGAYDSEIESLGGTIYRIPYVTDVGHRGYKNALNQFFKMYPNYKIVHSHMDKMSGIVLQSAKKAGIPVRVAHSHNTKSEGSILVRVYKWYSGQKINQSATHYYSCSSRAAQWLFGRKADECQILNNGIESSKFSYSYDNRLEIRKILKIGMDTMVFGHVGRFNYQKNHSYLIELFSVLNKVIPDSILILVGDGPLRQKIKGKVEKLKLEEKVIFMGVRMDIPTLLQGMDYFVFPSLHEGLPVTLVEAQAAGLPCLISDQITDEVDLELGLVHKLPLNNSLQWVKKLTELEKIQQPRNTRHELFVQKGFDIRETAQKTQDTYLAIGG